ncbi:hypothetical protein WJU23_20850 [Prosthecobacter sp. SYSU 5D2]|uniref:hypothetical protein n=1 Tax=Prosthecobacter sp. SYSU 5D2 TaxID=3134134 RepID=UPI0031FF1AD9
MPLPYTLLSLTAAAGLWWAGHALSCARPALQASAAPPVFALPGSAYGSLMARLIRDSLFSYWHGGESATTLPEPAAKKQAAPPPPPPGRFARKGAPPPPPPPAETEAPEGLSWADRQVDRLARLEKARTRRNNPLPMSAAHQRYVNAAGDVRLRLAYQLDPGDAILYEILHFHLSTRGPEAGDAKPFLDALANKAMAYGQRPEASLSDTLTGAGAAINLLNQELLTETRKRNVAGIQKQWANLEACLGRYHLIRHKAETEGWWERIPPLRRQELEEHARLLIRIRGMVKQTLEKPAAAQ